MSRRKTSPFLTALVVIGIALYWWFVERPKDNSASADQPQNVVLPGGSKENVGDYERLTGARMVEHRNNDGDSFYIGFDGKTYEMRIYYADCPEKRRHQYNGDRIRKQGEYFGGLSESEVTATGMEAKKFTHDLLTSRPFEIYTKWERVFDSERRYILLQVSDQTGRERFLHEILIEMGLARNYTKGETLPDGTSWKQQKNRLAAIENASRKARRGAWGK